MPSNLIFFFRTHHIIIYIISHINNKYAFFSPNELLQNEKINLCIYSIHNCINNCISYKIYKTS